VTEIIKNLLVALLPSWLKVFVLRARGAKIGKNCWIGFSVIDASSITIGDNVRVGHFNLLWRLRGLTLETGSAITMCNWITGARTGTFRVGRNSGITRFHFLEASAGIDIGANCIVAGRGSHFFTHGISSTNLDDKRPITIGDWCYIGSGSKFVPGTSIAAGTFVGMGSIVTKESSERFVMIAGAPATLKKQLAPTDAYFARSHLPQAHHPAGYEG
jgi:acetyltransferase-like isoleucine patch superfamily enzyme